MSASESDDEVVNSSVNGSSKKRKKFGSMFEADKKLRNSSYETGEDCCCKRYKCFTNVLQSERTTLIRDFNSLVDRNAQNSYLAGLIGVHAVKRRRPRSEEQDASLHDYSYTYKVRVVRENCLEEVPVCSKGFTSIFGITARRVQTIRASLATTGQAPIDQRGKHKNRGKNKLSNEIYDAMNSFFSSLKGRKAHYSLKDTNKIYLSEHLNVKKLLGMFLEKHPEIEMSYETFREHFTTNFNISFGYPRTDTCSTCDALKAKEDSIEKAKINTNDAEKLHQLDTQLKTLQTEKELHLKKAEWFYRNKKNAKKQARKNQNIEAITIDYGKNLPIPNISTNDVYYKRQLSFYLFNVHILSNGFSTFYCYDQTVAKKGSDDVVSMLHHFFTEVLSPQVRNLHIFADSCGGQNKNFTVIKYLHYCTVVLKKFDSVTLTFPVRGHSYMECDKNMALINQRYPAETPGDWRDAISSARVNPSAYNVIECTREMFKAWGSALHENYTKTFATPTRPIKQMKFVATQTQTASHRDTYNGLYSSTVIVKKEVQVDKATRSKQTKTAGKKKKAVPVKLKVVEPVNLHQGPIPLKAEKYQDLQALKRFCRQDAQEFIDKLPGPVQTAEVPEDRDSDY